MSAKGLSPETIRKCHRLLSQALAQAVRWQMVPRNVAQAAIPPRQPRKEKMRTLTEEGARRLQAAAWAEDTVYGDAVVLALHTGLRQGELLGLFWADMDWERRRLAVRRSLQHLPGQGTSLRPPKSARSRRSLPLGPTAVEVLRRLHGRQVENRLRLGPAYQDSSYVFSSQVGTPLIRENLRRAFLRIVARAGLEGVRFHDLRHTYATLLLRQNVHPKVVSERLGHSSVALTLDLYSHVLPSLEEEAALTLEGIIGQQNGNSAIKNLPGGAHLIDF